MSTWPRCRRQSDLRVARGNSAVMSVGASGGGGKRACRLCLQDKFNTAMACHCLTGAHTR